MPSVISDDQERVLEMLHKLAGGRGWLVELALRDAGDDPDTPPRLDEVVRFLLQRLSEQPDENQEIRELARNLAKTLEHHD